MHILFVDDNPEEKLEYPIRYLRENKADFTYVLHRSVHTAMAYIKEHESEIDLAVVDLYLPSFDGGRSNDLPRGLSIVDFIYEKYPKIHVIINSTATVKNDVLAHYSEKLIIRQHKPIYGDSLITYTQKGHVHIIEPNVISSGKIVFWIDSENKDAIQKYLKNCESKLSELNARFLSEKYPATMNILDNNRIMLTCPRENKDLFDFFELILRHDSDDMYMFISHT